MLLKNKPLGIMMQNGRQVLQLLDASIDLQVNHLVSNVLATNVFGVKELESMYASQAILPRDRPRFFDQVEHQTTNASIENKFFH